VLAYSTISQLGYMFVAVGLRAYAAAMFMLAAHAAYKALLFLSAGSVLHGMHDETDMKEMGGLRRAMPWTATVAVAGAISLAGVYGLGGYFAKDAILTIASESGQAVVYAFGTLGALLSAVYIGRLISLTFFAEPRSEAARTAHESPAVMLGPLVVLAVGALGIGVLALDPETGLLARFLEPVVGGLRAGTAGLHETALIGVSQVVAVGGLLLAWVAYASGRIDWLALRLRLSSLHRFLQGGMYVDDVYSSVLVAPGKAGAAFLAYRVDALAVDGAVNGAGIVVQWLARTGRRVQTGLVRNYALAFLVGALLLFVYVGFRL
jgi:NADH-quinone oxidoreductase subunit L